MARGVFTYVVEVTIESEVLDHPHTFTDTVTSETPLGHVWLAAHGQNLGNTFTEQFLDLHQYEIRLAAAADEPPPEFTTTSRVIGVYYARNP